MTFVISSPWNLSEADIRFRRTLIFSLAAGVFASLLVSIMPVSSPVKEKPEQEARFAEIILPPPEVIVPPKIVKPKVQPVEKEKPIPEPKKVLPLEEKVIVAVQEQTVSEAREKAKVAGLLAFQDQLQAMREQVDTNSDTAVLSRGVGQAAQIERAVITSANATKRASVNTSSYSSETGGIALSGRESTIVEALVEESATTGAFRMVRPDVNGSRSIEEIRRVFDANKGAIFSIYNRALRKDPSLLGKVVLELVIEPDGSVSACSVLASELQSQELVTRVVRRVQLFDFGKKDVAVTRISYPVHFLPT